MEKILLAGATGYLGGFILKELLAKGFEVKVIVRNEKKIPQSLREDKKLTIIHAAITSPETISNCCQGIDVVISTVGITKQKDGLTFMDVDYQANKNLLEDALKNGVQKFLYISVFNGEKNRDIKICEAKEKFVDALKASGLDYSVIRPTGYFSDMAEFFTMALKGKVFLFGNGNAQMNPIHGADLATFCVDALGKKEKVLAVGGPDIFTYNQIGSLAFSVTKGKTSIWHIPVWIGKWVLSLMKFFSSSKVYGPFEFFFKVITTDMIAPTYGSHTLKTFFEDLKESGQNK